MMTAFLLMYQVVDFCGGACQAPVLCERVSTAVLWWPHGRLALVTDPTRTRTGQPVSPEYEIYLFMYFLLHIFFYFMLLVVD